jgi:hypothetical protein
MVTVHPELCEEEEEGELEWVERPTLPPEPEGDVAIVGEWRDGKELGSSSSMAADVLLVHRGSPDTASRPAEEAGPGSAAIVAERGGAADIGPSTKMTCAFGGGILGDHNRDGLEVLGNGSVDAAQGSVAQEPSVAAVLGSVLDAGPGRGGDDVGGSDRREAAAAGLQAGRIAHRQTDRQVPPAAASCAPPAHASENPGRTMATPQLGQQGLAAGEGGGGDAELGLAPGGRDLTDGQTDRQADRQTGRKRVRFAAAEEEDAAPSDAVETERAGRSAAMPDGGWQLDSVGVGPRDGDQVCAGQRPRHAKLRRLRRLSDAEGATHVVANMERICL